MGSNFLFQNPPSPYIQGLEILQLLTGLVLGFTECKDIMHLKYSKFKYSKILCISNTPSAQVSSKTGMLILYAPAFLIASFFLFCKLDWPNASILLYKSGLLHLSITWQLHTQAGIRLLVLTVAVALHFFKRIVEVLFVHWYSGGMAIDSAILISFIYSFFATCFIYVMQISESLPSPSMNLMPLGLFLFIVGMSGNLYHHYLLLRLRKDGAKGYCIPQGGLFEFVVCPHYLFEIIAFFGLAIISQTAFGFCTAITVSLYLLGRTLSTKAWYVKKFEGFPSDRKALIPFLL